MDEYALAPEINMKKVLSSFFLFLTALAITGVYHSTQRPEINYHLGSRFFTHGRYEKAIPYFESSVKLDPLGKAAVRDLGLSYLWTKRPSEAIPLLKESVENYPENDYVLRALGDAYAWSGRYNEAIDIFRKILRVSADAETELKLAEVYMWSGKLKEAMIILERMAGRDPNNRDVLLLLGKALYYSGDSLAASRILEKLMEEMNG